MAEIPYMLRLFGLAPDGVYLADLCYQSRGALLPHHFTLTHLHGRYLSAALSSVGLRPPGVTRHHISVEPGLSSIM